MKTKIDLLSILFILNLATLFACFDTQAGTRNLFKKDDGRLSRRKDFLSTTETPNKVIPEITIKSNQVRPHFLKQTKVDENEQLSTKKQPTVDTPSMVPSPSPPPTLPPNVVDDKTTNVEHHNAHESIQEVKLHLKQNQQQQRVLHIKKQQNFRLPDRNPESLLAKEMTQQAHMPANQNAPFMMAEAKVINIVDDSDEFDTYNGQEYHPILSSHNDMNPTEDLNSILRESTEEPLLEEVVVAASLDSDKNNYVSHQNTPITDSENSNYNLKVESKSPEKENINNLSSDNKPEDSIVIEEEKETETSPKFSIEDIKSAISEEPLATTEATTQASISIDSTLKMTPDVPSVEDTSKIDGSPDVITTTEQLSTSPPFEEIIPNNSELKYPLPNVSQSDNSLEEAPISIVTVESEIKEEEEEEEEKQILNTKKEIEQPISKDSSNTITEKTHTDKSIVTEFKEPVKTETTTGSPPPTPPPSTESVEEHSAVFHNSRISSFSSLFPAVEANDSHIRGSVDDDFSQDNGGYNIINFEVGGISQAQTSSASAKTVNNVERKRESLENIEQNLDLDNNTNLRDEAERLKDENQMLIKRLELQKKLKPIRTSIKNLQKNIVGDYQTMINNRKIYNQRLKAMQNSAKKNHELRNKIEMSKYEQLRLIKNLVSLENLLDVMGEVEFQECSNNLKQSTFDAKMEFEFLNELIDTHNKLLKQFDKEYEELSREISIEKEIELSEEKEYKVVNKELILLKENTDSVDEWERKITIKMNKAYEYYKNYLFEYYIVQAYLKEQQHISQHELQDT